ncbi:MAG TPA: hypothetical protein VHF70_07850 [Rubrobacteraceae bacterium]|nr:hypothetical protein [Rubrobacteraceae bacterium]
MLTLFALVTSIWFPAPERPGPRVVEFLATEKEYHTGHWTRTRVLLGLLVPVSLASLTLAFWRRSLLYGLVVLDSIVPAKTAWSFYYGGESGWPCYRPPS